MVLPKGLIRPLQTPEETALNRILQDTGVRAKYWVWRAPPAMNFIPFPAPVRSETMSFGLP